MHTSLLALALLLPAAAHAIDLADQRGRRITLDKPAERVVFIPIPLPSTYMAVDGDERHIAGMNPVAMSAIREGILGRIFPGALKISSDITRGGRFTPNIETVLGMRPDVVFQWATEGPEVIEVLDRTGLKVIGIRYGTQEDMETYTGLMGQIAGKPERVQALFQRQAARRAELDRQFASLAEGAKPKVLYLQRFIGGLGAAGKASYHHWAVGFAGGRNAAAEVPHYNQPVTFEEVLRWDPDVILLGNFDDAKPADVFADPQWAVVSAVRNKRVYKSPLGGYRWDPPSQESALSWTWMALLFHPEAARFDLRADMRDWYDFLYRYKLSDAEIDAILFMGQNGRSAGYDRFRAR